MGDHIGKGLQVHALQFMLRCLEYHQSITSIQQVMPYML